MGGLDGELGEIEGFFILKADRIDFSAAEVTGDGDDFFLAAFRKGDGLDEADLGDSFDVSLFDGRVEHQSGDDEDEDGEDLDETAENRADPGVVLALCSEHALDDGLVRAPIPDAEHGVA